MGKQRIIIGCSGSFDKGLAAELVKLLGGKGLQVQHASHFYDGTGTTHFAVGTPADLTQELALIGHTAVNVERIVETLTGTSGEVPAGVTLETVNANVLKVLAQLSEKKTAARTPKEAKPQLEKKKGTEGKPDVELQQEDPAGKSAQGDGAGGGADDEKAADGGKEAGEAGPVRNIGNDGICTRCGMLFEEDLAAEDHINGPMCEKNED